ncbi:MAG: hypothetical protein WCD07_04895 [Burkholderiales bacterium]
MNKLFISFLLVEFTALSACGKAVETLGEKAVEKAIESQMEKDGNKSAKVSIGKDGFKSTVTDASGKTVKTEIGSAIVTEADVGVPFYPGASIKDGKGSKMAGPDGTFVTVNLESKDDLEKVAEYYRGKLKGMAAGRTLNDMSQAGESAMFMLSDEKNKNSVSISLNKNNDNAKATDIMIMTSKETKVN